MSREIKILHLYHDLMNLYGDWANVAALERELVARGCEVFADKESVGDDIDFSAYDFIYIGSGTERSVLACMKDLMQHKDALIRQVDVGTSVLATGNSHELFGKSVTDPDANEHEMLGLLDFETVQQNTRVTGDCVCTADFLEEKLIGFVNRAGGFRQGDIKRPFYLKPGEGANYSACTEGIQYKNLLGTYMTGPILVRNPPLLRYFADLLIGVSDKKNHLSDDMFLRYQEQAYSNALNKM